jgi:Nodulation protein Z (NodZ)
VVATASKLAGIGSRLLLFGEAVWLARRLGGSVLVDWRGTIFLSDPSVNYFTEFFVPVPEILGVRVHYAPSFRAWHYELVTARGTELPSKEDRLELDPHVVAQVLERPRSAPRYLRTRRFILHERRSKLEGRVTGRLAPAEAERVRKFLADFYRSITPRQFVEEELKRWYDENLSGHFVVGLNVATGNGLFAPDGKYPDYVDVDMFDDEDEFLGKIALACDRAASHLPAARQRDYKIFFATDSAQMAEVLGRLPRAVTRRSVFPPPGAGRDFGDYEELGHSDRDVALDTIVDMLLLARCDALVMQPTWFSFYALVVTDSFGGNVHDIEKI